MKPTDHTDTERIDWMQANDACIWCASFTKQFSVSFGSVVGPKSSSLREAIDSAITQIQLPSDPNSTTAGSSQSP